MNVPVTVNGISVEIPIDDKIIQEALKKKQKKTGYERVKDREYYYKDDIIFEFSQEQESNSCYDDSYYSSANYYSDKNVSNNNIRADRLMRQLRRFAAEHGGFSVGKNKIKWQILCEYKPDTLEPSIYLSSCDRLRRFGPIYFATEEAADEASRTFHNELMWYFTEYDPMPENWWND